MSEVYFSPVTASFENNPIGTIITGSPGSGKTFCMLNMAASCLEQGCRIFALDAKNDMIALKNVNDKVKITDVNNISPGSLDPFLVFDDIDSATILTIVELLIGSNLTQEQNTKVIPIISDFVNMKKSSKVTFSDFVQYLKKSREIDVRSIASQLTLVSKTEYGPLIFGEFMKESRAIKFDDSRDRIVSLFGMKLPTGNEKPMPDELVSSAVIYIICKMLEELMIKKGNELKKKRKSKKDGSKKNRPVVVFLDECHILMKSKALRDTINYLLVLGRSVGVSVVMASQNVTHFDNSIANLVSTKIAFSMSRKEATEFFDLFDNSTGTNEIDKAECIDVNTTLNTGYCFFIDSRHRCSLIHIESNYSLNDLSSNPLLKK